MGNILYYFYIYYYANALSVLACTLPRCIPCRYVYMILGFFGMLFCFALKTNLAMAMVSMVNHTAIRLEQDREHNLNTSKRHVHLDTVPEDELPVEHKEKVSMYLSICNVYLFAFLIFFS